LPSSGGYIIAKLYGTSVAGRGQQRYGSGALEDDGCGGLFAIHKDIM
jgi:hypothetical protein